MDKFSPTRGGQIHSITKMGYRQKGVYQNSKRRQPMFQVFRPMWYMQRLCEKPPKQII